MLKTFILIFISTMTAFSQTPDEVFEVYEKYKEPSLINRRFKHEDIKNLIKVYQELPGFQVKEEGKSIEGREIYSIEMGTGPVKILLWSQMHGDEATATMALMDLFRFFAADDEFNDLRKLILSETTLYFIPMLNPDGAEKFMRRNALGVDLNRDALRLQSPESIILKNKRDETNADFGFNLHDQGRVYSAGNAPSPATISFLATAYNYEKDMNELRENAMKVIGVMTKTLHHHMQGQIGKYSDDFEPRAFGDNIAKWGTSLILIESGAYPHDREKQYIRKMNFLAILQSLTSIADGSYKEETIEEYQNLPFNERLFFDLLIKNVKVQQGDNEYTLDVAMNHDEVDYKKHRKYYLKGSIDEVGDLSIYYGYDSLNAEGYTAEPGKVYPHVLNTKEIDALKAKKLFKEGYLFVRSKDSISSKSKPKFNILSKDSQVPDQNFKIGDSANFILKKDGKVMYVVINGFLVTVSDANDGGFYGNSFQK